MDCDVVIYTTSFAGHVIVGQLDVQPSFIPVLVDTGDSESRQEYDIADVGTESLWARIDHEIIVVVVVAKVRPESVAHQPGRVVGLPRVMPSSEAALEGVPRVIAGPKPAVRRPGGAIILRAVAKVRVGASTPFSMRILRRGRVLTLGVQSGSCMTLGDRDLLESCLLHQDFESAELIMNQSALREVDGMHHRCGSDEVVAGS